MKTSCSIFCILEAKKDAQTEDFLRCTDWGSAMKKKVLKLKQLTSLHTYEKFHDTGKQSRGYQMDI